MIKSSFGALVPPRKREVRRPRGYSLHPCCTPVRSHASRVRSSGRGTGAPLRRARSTAAA